MHILTFLFQTFVPICTMPLMIENLWCINNCMMPILTVLRFCAHTSYLLHLSMKSLACK